MTGPELVALLVVIALAWSVGAPPVEDDVDWSSPMMARWRR